MDRIENPFTPGAGTTPPELAGREAVLEEANVTVKRAAAGKTPPCLVLTGLRGVGKTVLLVRIQSDVEQLGHLAVRVEAREHKRLPALLAPSLHKILLRCDTGEQAKALARHALTFLQLLISAVTVQVGDAELGVGAHAVVTGDIEEDIPALFVAVGEAARAARRTVVVLIDEMQSLTRPELSAIVIAMHLVNQAKLPIALIGAALPPLRAAAAESNPYAERQFQYVDVGALPSQAAWWAVRAPIEAKGKTVSNRALQEIMRHTRGYPYFIQQWASDTWNVAPGPDISIDDVKRAEFDALNTLDKNLFRVRLERCSLPERRVMAAMSALKAGNDDSYFLADARVALSDLTQGEFTGHFEQLMQKGMIYQPSSDRVAFTVPLFADFMRRTRL